MKTDPSEYDCTYCGMTAADMDHVVPWSYDNLGKRSLSPVNRVECVPACKECNVLLSNFFITTVASRAAFIAKRLARRYADLLRSPDWTEDEYNALSGRLRDHVKAMQTKKRVVQARIAYAEVIAKLTDLTIDNVWENHRVPALTDAIPTIA